MARKTREEAGQTRQQIIDAARQVFHAHGVGQSSLEKVAQAAGVTRGAVYWHFANKAELFFAVKASATQPLIEQTDRFLLDDGIADPLDAIEQMLRMFFQVLLTHRETREIFEIMTSRCEFVGEFAAVQAEVHKPAFDFLDKIESVYRRAAEREKLRPGLTPHAAALDTLSFVGGLFHLLLTSGRTEVLEPEIENMVKTHVALRRKQA